MFGNFQEEVIEALAIVNSNLWQLLLDRSIGKYMAKSKNLVLSTNEEFSRVILDINQVIHHIGVDSKPVHMAPFKNDFLFTTSSDGYLF